MAKRKRKPKIKIVDPKKEAFVILVDGAPDCVLITDDENNVANFAAARESDLNSRPEGDVPLPEAAVTFERVPLHHRTSPRPDDPRPGWTVGDELWTFAFVSTGNVLRPVFTKHLIAAVFTGILRMDDRTIIPTCAAWPSRDEAEDAARKCLAAAKKKL